MQTISEEEFQGNPKRAKEITHQRTLKTQAHLATANTKHRAATSYININIPTKALLSLLSNIVYLAFSKNL